MFRQLVPVPFELIESNSVSFTKFWEKEAGA